MRPAVFLFLLCLIATGACSSSEQAPVPSSAPTIQAWSPLGILPRFPEGIPLVHGDELLVPLSTGRGGMNLCWSPAQREHLSQQRCAVELEVVPPGLGVEGSFLRGADSDGFQLVTISPSRRDLPDQPRQAALFTGTRSADGPVDRENLPLSGTPWRILDAIPLGSLWAVAWTSGPDENPKLELVEAGGELVGSIDLPTIALSHLFSIRLKADGGVVWASMPGDEPKVVGLSVDGSRMDGFRLSHPLAQLIPGVGGSGLGVGQCPERAGSQCLLRYEAGGRLSEQQVIPRGQAVRALLPLESGGALIPVGLETTSSIWILGEGLSFGSRTVVEGRNTSRRGKINDLGSPPHGVLLAASDRYLVEVVASLDASEHPQPLRPARMFSLPLAL